MKIKQYALFFVLAAMLLATGCATKTPQQTVFEYTYQVGSFVEENNAVAFEKLLTELGFKVIVEKADVDGVLYHRVFVRHSGPLDMVFQVGSFTNESNAMRVVDNLKRQGFDASIRKVEIDGTIFHRVFVFNRDSLEEFRNKIASLGLEQPQIVSIKSEYLLTLNK